MSEYIVEKKQTSGGVTIAERIKDTRIQIGKTESKQRKYELHRNLNKLLKQQRRENNGRTNRI